jgi:hypothetical protein
MPPKRKASKPNNLADEPSNLADESAAAAEINEGKISDKYSLNIQTFTKLWESKFLPSIRDKFRAEITDLKF